MELKEVYLYPGHLVFRTLCPELGNSPSKRFQFPCVPSLETLKEVSTKTPKVIKFPLYVRPPLSPSKPTL